MRESKLYTIPSKQDYVDDLGYPRSQIDSNNVFAKAVKEVKSKNILDRSPTYFKYYVKIEPNKSLYNPFTKNVAQSSRTSFVDKICKSENTFLEVNQSVFDKYINYLKTENQKWLTDAQREVR